MNTKNQFNRHEDDYTSNSKKIFLYCVAKKMNDNGLPSAFIVQSVESAIQHERIYDLMVLWLGADNDEEKYKIVKDIENMIQDIKNEPDL